MVMILPSRKYPVLVEQIIIFKTEEENTGKSGWMRLSRNLKTQQHITQDFLMNV